METLFLILSFLNLLFIVRACITNADCESTTPKRPYCIEGTCVAYCKQDSDCQSTWEAATCVMNLCSCYNDAQCPGNLICSRTDPAKGKCVTCETEADRGCTQRAAPTCKPITTTVPINSVPTSVTTYSCQAPTSDANCIHNALMYARDRTVYKNDGGGRLCASSTLDNPCSTSVQCISPSAPKCSGSKCTLPSGKGDCAEFGNKKAWIDHSCVECTANDDCTTPGKEICDVTTYLCVECFSDDNCPNNNELCINNQCQTIDCLDSNECFHAYPQCASGICRACSTDTECITWLNNGGYACDLTSRKCVPAPDNCLDIDNCTAVTKPVCLNYLCVGCTTDTVCVDKFSDSGQIHCSSGTCVECIENSDCTDSTKPICSGNQCVSCSSDSECSGFTLTKKCNIGTGTCVQCTANSHCTDPTKPICSGNQCAPCTFHSDCAGFTLNKICFTTTGACVECLGNGDCTTETSPSCSSSGLCGPCSYDSDCSGFGDKNKCNLSNGACQFMPIPNVTVTLQSTSNAQVFQLVFSSSMKIPGALKDNLRIDFSNLSPGDFTLLNITQKSDGTIFELKFEFQKSVNVQTLTITFIDPRYVLDTQGYCVKQSSVQTQTRRFSHFTPQETTILETARTAGTAATSTAMASSAIIAVFAGNPVLLLTLLNIFQVTNDLLYMNVNYPDNVNTFFNLFSVSSFNFIPNPIEMVAPKLFEEMQIPLNSPPKFLDNEMDARFLNNCGLMITGWGIIGFLYLVIRILLSIFRIQGAIGRLFYYLKDKFEWGLIFGTLIGSYPNLFLAAMLQLNNLNFHGSLNLASSIVGIFFGLVCILAPFISIHLIDSTSPQWGSKQHHDRYRILYNGFKFLDREEDAVSPEIVYCRRNFLAIMLFRRIAYLSALVFAYDIPFLQIACTCGSGVIILICMWKFKPYEESRDAWLNIGSEIILLMAHLVIFVFAGDDIAQKLSDEQRKIVGWVIVGLCSLLVAYNFCFVLVEQIGQIRNFIMYLVRLRRIRKTKTTRKRKSISESCKEDLKPETLFERIEEIPEFGKDESASVRVCDPSNIAGK